MDNHTRNNNDITLSLKTMTNFNRYGFVTTTDDGKVISFEEKKYRKNTSLLVQYVKLLINS